MTVNEMVSLGLIYSQPCHAYALDGFIREAKLDEWANISRATIYNTLKRLESEGCVTVETEKIGNMPERKVYSITEKGKQRLVKVLRKNMLQINGNTFALSMLFCFGMSPSEAIEILEKRILLLKKESTILKISSQEPAKFKIFNWMIFYDSRIKNLELEIESTLEFIKLFKIVPHFYEKNLSERYRYKIEHSRK